MTFKLLIDECLSPKLADKARRAGHHESSCVRDRGWSGLKDWELTQKLVKEDLTLVTHNAVDFRGDGPDNLGGHHVKQIIHAGLICLNSVHGMTLPRQMRLFEIVLEALSGREDLINQALEIWEADDGSVNVDTYDIPLP